MKLITTQRSDALDELVEGSSERGFSQRPDPTTTANPSKLVFVHYVDSTPAAVEFGLTKAIAAALDATLQRTGETCDEIQTEWIERGLRLNGGMAILNGSEIRVSGTPRLTAIQVAVPWSRDDNGGPKLSIATRFATVVAEQARLAA